MAQLERSAKMKKLPRILLNLLLPPVVAVSTVFIPVTVYSAELPALPFVITVLLVAYGFAAIPCIIHTIVMERFYRRGLRPSQGRAVGIYILKSDIRTKADGASSKGWLESMIFRRGREDHWRIALLHSTKMPKV